MSTPDDPGAGTPEHGDAPLSDMQDPRVVSPEVMAGNERTVRRSFWEKLRRTAGRLPFAEDLVAAYLCALAPDTPVRVRGVLLAALAYFIAPADLLPDMFAGIGFTDDAGVLLAALKIVGDHITPEHKARARELLDKPTDEDA